MTENIKSHEKRKLSNIKEAYEISINDDSKARP